MAILDRPHNAVDIPARFEASAASVTLSAGTPMVFGDPAVVWLLASGSFELFAVQRLGGRQTGARTHLCTLPAGTLIWGIDQSDRADGVHLLALSEIDVRLLRLSIAELRELIRLSTATATFVADCLDLWVCALSQGVAKHLSPRKPISISLAPGDDLQVADQDRVTSRRGVAWVEIVQGIGRYADVTEIKASTGAIIPITSPAWLEARDDARMIAHSSTEMVGREDLPYFMDLYHGWVFFALAYDLRNVAMSETVRLGKRETYVTQATSRTFTEMVSLLLGNQAPVIVSHADDALFECCALVGRTLGVTMVMPPWARRRRSNDSPLTVTEVAAASQVQVREVVLRGAWWRQDGGPLVGVLEESRSPVALIPRGARAYVLHDPATGVVQPVDAKVAATLAPIAQMIYPSLPVSALDAGDLLRFGFRTIGVDLVTMLFAGVLAGLLTTIVPLATGYVFDNIIPGHQTAQMIQVAVALLAAAFAAGVFHYTLDVAQLRIEGRVAARLQGAMMDRLLRLPIAFYSNYSVGDLAQRVMAIDSIRSHLTGAVLGAMIVGLFSLFNLVLLAWYSPVTAGMALVLLVILAIVVALFARKLTRAARLNEDMVGKVNSLVLEIIGGIAKLRLAGAEERAFNLWGGKFREMRSHQIRVRSLLNSFAIFWAFYELACLAAIFAVITSLSHDRLSTGLFLALVAAFTSLLSAAGGLAKGALTVAAVVPQYHRLAPILTTVPETSTSKADPGSLTGGFEITGLRFRYGPDMPWVLDGVSIAARPGEFIALVGPSGCGKSTLIRLLLGMERPEAGGVFYDGHDMRNLDLNRVRKQIGVVLQNGKLIPGSLFENIQGSSQVNLEQCWEAAAQAGIADDINAMPMGMHTVLTEGTTALSGGQIQRLLIARAIVGQPRLLLLDEATSALDNRVQSIVTESLEKLMTTRVVVAHRLSTVAHADRIYVLSEGKVIEIGSYDDLVARNGLFTELVARQRL